MFEITATDLLGRKGFIETKKGTIQTPAFVPVVHPEPLKNLVNVNDFQEKFKIDFIITSSYILKKRFGSDVINLHDLTGFSGPIMTDSGAYQSLVYGEIEFTPKSVIDFQESIGSDFAVPLDIPVSLSDSYFIAKDKVLETIKRSKDLPKLISDKKINWVAPIQGGHYLDLVEKSAKELTDVPLYSMFAIGSVVELMKNYQYDILIEIILKAKKYLEPSKPIHLFGAGHPSMFPFIIAAGCDTFDSAAYSLYAQEGRYLTSTQTFLLSELEEFPCHCPICSKYSPKDLLKMNKDDRMKSLANHNLYVCQAEILNIRRAISSGTLWNLLENRSRVHPNLKKGFDILIKHSRDLVSTSPSTKKKGLFFVSASDIYRPEILIHQKRFSHLTFTKRKKLLLISLINIKSNEFYEIFQQLKNITKQNKDLINNYEIWCLTEIFGLIPLEISEVYPLSQIVFSHSITIEQLTSILDNAFSFINDQSFTKIILIGELQFLMSISNKLDLTKTNIKSYNFSISDKTISNVSNILDLAIT
ncbi:MAG: tRNA guanosine(15) transglycosylase TgtA [Asgard group archaeon]|nr:tRNA guanosine(15) transglycosylase TgtA [Asgard group archaeon]